MTNVETPNLEGPSERLPRSTDGSGRVQLAATSDSYSPAVMNAQAVPAIASSVLAYDPAAVDAFLASATGERNRLEAVISEARGRSARARAALAAHDELVAIVVEARKVLMTQRAEAEDYAQRVLAAAEDEAASIVADATAERSSTEESILDLRPGNPIDGVDLTDQPARPHLRDASMDRYSENLRALYYDGTPA
jgi:hypothetical protein